MYKRFLMAGAMLLIALLIIYLLTSGYMKLGMGIFAVFYFVNFVYQYKKTGKVKFL